mmetsp:Transcript_13835/g.20428  ORF Transcript_13835/g.20428 Transcript_13835/m.20428 type:complete len:101 (-) Transcript_13835:856-1158(-)
MMLLDLQSFIIFFRIIIPCRVLLEKRFGYISKCYSGNKGIVLYSVYLEKLSDIHGTIKKMTIATQFCNISFLQQLCDYTSVNFILENIAKRDVCIHSPKP